MLVTSWKKRNPEKVREQGRRWRKKNSSRLRIRQKLWRKNNPEKSRSYSRNWRLKNLEKVKARDAQYKKANRAKIVITERAWQERNRERLCRQRRERRKIRLKDPAFRLERNLRKRVYSAVRGRTIKSDQTAALIGCSFSNLRLYLARQFQPGMSWENYGPVWHVDHIKPCAKFDLTDPEQQKACFHYTNLQPLWASDNLRKGAKSLALTGC